MPSFDPKKNFAFSTIAVAPTPALSGLTMQVTAGEGGLFPAAGAGVAFNAVVCPSNAPPSVSNAEIIRVTVRAGDAVTILRAQEGSSARAIQVGDRIIAGITVKTITDIEAALATAGGAIVLTAQPILEPGVAGQVSRGRVLTLADFATLLGLSAPVAGWNLSDLTDFSGNGRSLTNKGAVTFGSGITGAATEAAIFTGSTGQALYVADAGAGDPFRIPYGSIGCWFKTAKKATAQVIISKSDAGATSGWNLEIISDSVGLAIGSFFLNGVSTVTDDRWHFVVATYDGSVISIYVDGALETQSTGASGPISYAAAYPFNIGGRAADGGTAASNPHFGRSDEALVTQDVLSLEQIRMLYAAKVAHGFGTVPIGAKVSVRRQRRGAALAAGIFSTTPLHLYNFTAGALTDAGSLGNALTNNGAAAVCPAPDGSQGSAFNFVSASSQNLSASDAGLPTGTSARTVVAWFKTVAAAQGTVICYGTAQSTMIYLTAAGLVSLYDGSTDLLSPTAYNDGQWHLAVGVMDGAAADGLKRKLYIDGKLVASSTTFVTNTLLGANGFRIGSTNVPNAYFNGQIDRVPVLGYAASADEIAKWYAQGDLSLGVSPKNAGSIVEGMDATNVYLVADALESQNLLDLEVTA